MPRVVRVVAVGSPSASVGAAGAAVAGAGVAGAGIDVTSLGAVGGVGVIVVGEAGAVGAAVAAIRGDGVRVAGFVGDASDPACRAAVTSMAVELFAADQVSFPPYPGEIAMEEPTVG